MTERSISSVLDQTASLNATLDTSRANMRRVMDYMRVRGVVFEDRMVATDDVRPTQPQTRTAGRDPVEIARARSQEQFEQTNYLTALSAGLAGTACLLTLL